MRALGLLMRAGSRGTALADLATAAAIADGLTDPQLLDHVDAFATLGSAEFMVELFDTAERHLTRIRRVTRASGRVHLQTNLSLGLGSLYGRTGRLRQALECFDDALESATLTESHEQRALSQASRSWILVWLGDVDEATAAAQDAAAHAGALPGAPHEALSLPSAEKRWTRALR